MIRGCQHGCSSVDTQLSVCTRVPGTKYYSTTTGIYFFFYRNTVNGFQAEVLPFAPPSLLFRTVFHKNTPSSHPPTLTTPPSPNNHRTFMTCELCPPYTLAGAWWTTQGALNSFTLPKSSPVIKCWPSDERWTEFTSVPS